MLKNPTHLSKRVEHVVPGVVVLPCLSGWCFTEGNLIAPFPLGQNCPRKNTVTMTIEQYFNWDLRRCYIVLNQEMENDSMCKDVRVTD